LDLGVLFDKKMTFIPHIENIINRALRILGLVLRNFKCLKHSKTKIVLYNSLVRSLLEYCSVVWRPHYSVLSLRLEHIQKRFLWYLAFAEGKAKTLVSYESRLHHFHLLALDKRRDIIDAIFAYKIFNNRIDCSCGAIGLFCFRIPRRIPRAPITPLCPPLRRTVLGANSPVPRLCKCVNSLSDVVNLHSSLASFRGVLNRHISGL
jgi:hypothetical protein